MIEIIQHFGVLFQRESLHTNQERTGLEPIPTEQGQARQSLSRAVIAPSRKERESYVLF